ncbi:FAD-binding oxidoreductase [Pseudomonas sp. S37]|uniref:NAD(P)/FAD-dependent oxidoreductase n=1 Tax=Pseudomonas sp. S37 TaxID=2767449 RepID=UPI001911DCFE|nr:FAD-binding oxidoreductase [Pseudomonas sp. S37]MBK4992979.1 FAD-binding oxidoreductase [Pseudomonas sp. S37]
MAGNSLRVAVVGAGILGASIAWSLARKGARVTVFEREHSAGLGVTGHSYGWVGTASRLPSDNPGKFALELQALGEFARLKQAIGPFPVATQGALIWLDSHDESLAMLAEQQAAGVNMTAIGREKLRELEPALAHPPELALWAPDEFAVEPRLLACRLLGAAQAQGAQLIESAEVLAVELDGLRVSGVRTAVGTVPVDRVVLANAMGAQTLVTPLDVHLPIVEEPAVLLRFDAQPAPLRHLLYAQSLELRPGLGGGLFSAADFPGHDRLDALGQESLVAVRQLFRPGFELSLRSVQAVQRPKTVDGRPLCGFLPGFKGLYVAVAHPGVILAPFLGRLASAEILGELN